MISVNLLAVLVVAIISVAIGGLWYSPLLFGKQWMKLANVVAKGENPAKAYILGFLTSLLTAYVLGSLIVMTASFSAALGAQLGFWIWLGFAAPMALGSVLWEGKSVQLFLINAAYWLVNLVVGGLVLGVWA